MNISNLPVIGTEVGKRGIILVFSASENAPAYEAQMRLLDEEVDAVEASDVVLACILAHGESRMGTRRIEAEDAASLREAFALEPDAFQIIVLDSKGAVSRRDDAPLQVSALLASTSS